MAEYKFKGPKKVIPGNEPKKDNPVVKFKGPREPEKKKDEGDWLSNTGDFVTKTMRNFNDALTFGFYDDILQGTGIDPNATAKLNEAKADPAANIIGSTAGYMVPGLGLEALTAKAIPALAKNTIPAIMGRNALASGELSTIDQAAREGKVDPLRLAIDAGTGGALSGVLAGASRGISPEARVRAMGNDLTAADKEAATGFADYADEKGIKLTAPEAVNAVAPERAGSVMAGYTSATKSPAGARVTNAFNEARTPSIEQAGKDFVSDILYGKKTGISSIDASKAASEALDTVRGGFKATADPLYAAAEKRKVPPSWLQGLKGGYTDEAMKSVANDKGMVKGLIKANGGQVPQANQLLFLDQVKKELDGMVKGFQANNRGARAGYAADEAAALTEKLDSVAPTYPQARAITEQGGDVLSSLEAGPLGTISNASNLQTQSNALFGPTTGAGVEASLEAANHLPDQVNLGMLANHIENASAKSPANWANKALPTEPAATVADTVLRRAGKEEASGVLGAARAVNNKSADPFVHENSGPVGTAWSTLMDFGKGRVAKKLTDPKSIGKFGRMGVVQALINDILRGGVASSSNARGEDNPMWTDPSMLPPK